MDWNRVEGNWKQVTASAIQLQPRLPRGSFRRGVRNKKARPFGRAFYRNVSSVEVVDDVAVHGVNEVHTMVGVIIAV